MLNYCEKTIYNFVKNIISKHYLQDDKIHLHDGVFVKTNDFLNLNLKEIQEFVFEVLIKNSVYQCIEIKIKRGDKIFTQDFSTNFNPFEKSEINAYFKQL